jgi:succinate-semialdehyde dehydrogenase / glutarate-semialdehyde dehydrogenase
MSIQTINPATNKLIRSFPEMEEPVLESAVALATETFQEWKITSYPHRAALLHHVASLLRKQINTFAPLITLEMGKLISQAEGEIKLSADIFDYYANHGENFLADIKLSPEFGQAIVRSSPIGVLLGIEPWNFPFYQVARFSAPNIMIGNVVLVKHASSVPQCGMAIEALFNEAGAPLGLYTNELVADERIKGVSLTGSEEAGASVAAAAGKHLKKSVLELGGSDAFIILEDADLNRAVEWAVVGRINNNGECCVASKRFIAVEKIADAFLEKFQARLSNLKIGDPMDRGTELGPLSSEEAAVHIADQVTRSVKAGAKILIGGKRIDQAGAFMEPTILTDLTPDNPAYHEELFGPVASFYRVKDEEAAIKLANDTNYGLGSSVFTQDIARGHRVADLLDTGMVFINHPTWTQADLPFGGTKRSGYGRELSALGMQEFVNKKLIRTSALTDPF